MLLWLTEWLALFEAGFTVFQYLTLRAIVSLLTALLLSLVFGPWLIKKITNLQLGQVIRPYGVKEHLKKNGTPTMGGILIILSISIATISWGDLTNHYILVFLMVLISFGLIGLYDDVRKVIYKDPEGMRSRIKFLLQSILALVVSIYLFTQASEPIHTGMVIPFFKDILIPLGAWYVLLTYFVIVGSSNAANMTDGLDGLAIVPTMGLAGALAIFAYTQGNFQIASYLNIPYIAQVGELVVPCAAMMGASIGFLWFNTYPAQIFMGDVGSLSLGAALGVVAVMIRQEIVFAFMAGIFVIEALSVIIQVGWYKYSGKRIFLMAPIHHHFELLGWPEPRIIVRFWIITIILIAIGLASLKIR